MFQEITLVVNDLDLTTPANHLVMTSASFDPLGWSKTELGSYLNAAGFPVVQIKDTYREFASSTATNFIMHSETVAEEWHGRSLDLATGVSVMFEQAGKQKTSVFLEYLPVGIKDRDLKATLAPYAVDEDITVHKSPRQRADERTIRMRVAEPARLPHFITFKKEMEGMSLSKTSSVRLRGCRQKCFFKM